MTDNYRDLIEEARREIEVAGSGSGRVWYGLVMRLADALGALLARLDLTEETVVRLVDERDEARKNHAYEVEQKLKLAAQIAAVKGALPGDPEYDDYGAKNVRKRLSADPADLLRQHDAKVWDEAIDAQRGLAPAHEAEVPVNPYRKADDE